MTARRSAADYPSRAVARRQAEIAREVLGVDPVAVEVAPGGVIRFYAPGAFPALPKDEFEAWETGGKL